MLAVPAFGRVQGDLAEAVPGGAGGDGDQVAACGRGPGLRERQGCQGPGGAEQRSAFSWEPALDYIKPQMPDAEPYRAWQTFTFTTERGHIREADLFIATPSGLFLVEIKSQPGIAANHGSTWLFHDGDTTRTIENPLHFTDTKAKELETQLERAARKLS